MDEARENDRKLEELVSNSSLIDFLNNEEQSNQIDENQLFKEIGRLASLSSSTCKLNVDDDDDLTIEELLKEAETLINQPIGVDNFTLSCESTPLEIRNNVIDQYDYSTNKTLSHPDVSFNLFLLGAYAVDTALAITCMKASVSCPVLMIWSAGSIKPCRPVSLSSTVYEYLSLSVPFAQSSLPPEAGYNVLAAAPTVYWLPLTALIASAACCPTLCKSLWSGGTLRS